MASAKSFALKALRSNIAGQRLSKTLPAQFQNSLVKAQPFQRTTPRPAFVPVRWHSIPASARSKDYDFTQVKEFVSSPSEDRLLIGTSTITTPQCPTSGTCLLKPPPTDVREPSEYQAGFIPGAINIPVKSQPDAMFLPEEEFEDRFGFSKPAMDKELVFYCKAGVRSSAAAQLAKQFGYENVAEYKGSWMDWERNGGESSKP
jgi:rhodanese-related sulfurtransferase